MVMTLGKERESCNRWRSGSRLEGLEARDSSERMDAAMLLIRGTVSF